MPSMDLNVYTYIPRRWCTGRIAKQMTHHDVSHGLELLGIQIQILEPIVGVA